MLHLIIFRCHCTLISAKEIFKHQSYISTHIALMTPCPVFETLTSQNPDKMEVCIHCQIKSPVAGVTITTELFFSGLNLPKRLDKNSLCALIGYIKADFKAEGNDRFASTWAFIHCNEFLFHRDVKHFILTVKNMLLIKLISKQYFKRTLSTSGFKNLGIEFSLLSQQCVSGGRSHCRKCQSYFPLSLSKQCLFNSNWNLILLFAHHFLCLIISQLNSIWVFNNILW